MIDGVIRFMSLIEPDVNELAKQWPFRSIFKGKFYAYMSLICSVVSSTVFLDIAQD
jgi:hypothetical protein